MKKLIFTFLFIISSIVTYGQGCVYEQHFENPITGITSAGNPGWVGDTQLYHDGVQSYHATFNATDSAIATTDDIDLSGNTFVILKFWHICKMEFFDQGLIQVSNDGGLNWTNLTGAQYLGTSNFALQGNKFTEAAYPAWHPGDTLTPVDSSWWREEQFDISALVGTGTITNAKVRFVAKDLNLNGMNGRVGWYLDEICVLAAPCELTKPTLSQAAPVYQGTVYSLGPYTLNAYSSDGSGVAGVYLFYTVNSGTVNVVPMVNPLGDSAYTAQIPAAVDGDTICYYFYSFDASACANEIYYPADILGLPVPICYVVSSGITFPYCDNFDVNNLWLDSLVTGSPWELGTPNFGLTNSAHSAPNAWDISLNSGYSAGTQSYLISPVFDFATASNVRMSFWYNSATDNFDQDGVRLETSVNLAPWTILTTASDPSATNWYNVASLSSSGTPGWGGNSNGWKEAKFNMSVFNLIGTVQMRFIFQAANFSSGDGFSIDDFCLIQPPPEDMGVDKVIEPFPSSGAGMTSNAIVRVRNYGTSIQTTFDVAYSINGVLQGTVPYAGPPLAPNDTAIVTITPTFTVPALNYDFCAWTILPTDADNTNDSICVTRQGIPVVPLTYCNDFDISGADWTSIPSPIGNTVWELGTPNFGTTNTAYSNPNSWDINLTTAYDNQANAILVSPFFDFTTSANVDLSFWQNRRCEAFWDGTRIEYSDNGNPWQVLGAVGQGVNWYTNASINSSQLPAWDGTTNGTWVKSSLNVSLFNNIGLVQLQFVFTSDFSVIQDGFSIDNFCLHVPQPIDVGVDSILSPTTNSGALQNVDVTVRVRNFGSTSISAFDVYYVYNSVTYGPVAYTGPALAPNDVVLITIPPQINIPNGVFSLCAYTSLATDMDNTNDTICKNCKGIPVLPLNYCENFDGTANDWTPVTVFAGSQWELGTPNFGATNSAHSAPNAWDVNLNTGYTSNANCELLSPFFDLGTAVNAELSFWQNRNTQAFNDGTRIDISTNGGPWSTLGTVGDPLASNWYTIANIFVSGQPAWDGTSGGWKKSTYQMVNYNNIGLVQLNFVFRSSNFTTGDGMSIDDFCMRIPPPIDAGTVSIDGPTGGLVIGNLYYPTVTIKNYGSADIDSIPVTYAINGTPQATEYYYPVLIPNQTAQITFTTGFNALSGGFNLCAYTEKLGDGDHFNDTTCITMVGVPTLIPTYTDDFDGINNGWTTNNVSGAGSIWELGTPAFGATSTPHSAPNSWDVNLSSAYTNQANCELISPFFDFLNVINAEISFWMNYSTENNWDGTRIDYSADGGATWNTLGSVGCASCLNWYTKASINSSGKPAWDANSGGWVFSKDSDLTFLNANPLPVIFKFVFTSDFSVTGDGVSVDDFNLYKPITLTAATNLVYPANNILTPGPQLIVGRYINKGTTPMTSVLLTLVIDNVLHVTDTINPIPGGQLNLNVQALHTFSLPWNASPGQHTLCIYTSMPNGSPDLNNADDTTCTVLTVFDSTSIFPYCNDFESGPQWVALNSVDYTNTSSWQIGTPVKTNLVGSHSGANCWVTNLVSEYPNEDNSSLFSPVFNVVANKCYELSFWHNADMDLFNDGGNVEYSIDSAKTWTQLGDGGDYLNWYNSIYIAAFGGPPVHAGWTGTFGGWLQSSHNWQCPQTGQVIFRWRFASDLTNTADGWSIDDVCFKEIAGTCVTAVGDLEVNGFYLYQNTPNPTNGSTAIAFSLPKQGKAVITVTNLVGQIVAQPVNANMSEGRHSIDLNSKDFAPGIYYYTLNFDGRKIVRKMVITE